MKQDEISYFEWTRKFATEQACRRLLEQVRWGRDGFRCPRCDHDQAYHVKSRALHECKRCRRQTSVTAGTMFDRSRVPLTKWFAAIYLVGTDKGGISALRLSKMIGVEWRTARLMLQKLRAAMADRDRRYLLDGLIELDDTYVGGKRPGKRGRGAQGRKPVLFAVQNNGQGAGFMHARVVDSVNSQTVEQFCSRLCAGASVRSDAFSGLRVISKSHEHYPKVTPPDQVADWLPLVHIVISNLKTFLLGTFHGVSHQYMQEYVDEFVYRFNRRRWEKQIPLRLLQAAVDTSPMRLILT